MPALLTLETLRSEAVAFAKAESKFPEPSLFGVTDGKAVGTYLEHKFQAYLQGKYQYVRGSSAKGIDFPELDTISRLLLRARTDQATQRQAA